jgi:predicted Co/Zn/Cd cation transporter (cation efflux family)
MDSTSASHTDSRERALLRFSVWMAIFFAVLGIVWGMAIQSGAILFDGIYSGFSIILSMLSILSLRMIGMTEDPMAKLDGDERFPFGRVGIEPLVVALKSIVIIGVCLYAVVTSVLLLLNGGSVATSSLLGMLYAGISIVLCLFSWLYLKIRGKGLPMLVQAESEQWLIDTVFSGVVLAGFTISYALTYAGYETLVPFIDPGIVLLGSLYFIRVPLLRFASCMRELLMMAPAEDIKLTLQEHVDRVAAAHGFTRAVVRSAKVGRELTVDIAFLAHSEFGSVDIDQLDTVREEVREALSDLGYRIWMNVIFTKDSYWA